MAQGKRILASPGIVPPPTGGEQIKQEHSAGPSTEQAVRPSYLSVIATKVKKDGETALEETEGLE